MYKRAKPSEAGVAEHASRHCTKVDGRDAHRACLDHQPGLADRCRRSGKHLPDDVSGPPSTARETGPIHCWSQEPSRNGCRPSCSAGARFRRPRHRDRVYRAVVLSGKVRLHELLIAQPRLRRGALSLISRRPIEQWSHITLRLGAARLISSTTLMRARASLGHQHGGSVVRCALG